MNLVRLRDRASLVVTDIAAHDGDAGKMERDPVATAKLALHKMGPFATLGLTHQEAEFILTRVVLFFHHELRSDSSLTELIHNVMYNAV